MIGLGLVLGTAPTETRSKSTSPEIEPGFQRAPVLQSLGERSVTIAWIAAARGESVLDYGTSPSDFGTSVEASSHGSRRHVTLSDLEPGTTYYYRVRAGDRVLAQGPYYRFRTDAGPTNRTFNFFVTGDIGVRRGKQVRTATSILRAQPLPDFGILCGDIVYKEGRSSDYDVRLMHPWQNLFCQFPIWPALGNHDWKSSPKKNWEVEWHLPNNEHYYSFDYGSAHFVALDTRKGEIYEASRQVRWLEDDLAANRDAEWTFVYFHHPGLTCTYKGDNEAVISRFLPVFDRYEVDVVFQGHAHTYERLYPIRELSVVDAQQDPHYVDPRGTIYIVSGAGGQVERGDPTRYCGPTAFFRDETILWTQVFVEGAKCTIRTYESANQALVDEVTITKTDLSVVESR